MESGACARPPVADIQHSTANYQRAPLQVIGCRLLYSLFMSKNGSPAHHISKSGGCERTNYSTRSELRPSQVPRHSRVSRIMTTYPRIFANNREFFMTTFF